MRGKWNVDNDYSTLCWIARPDPPFPTLSDEEEHRLFTPKPLELLRVLHDRDEGELTISELARLLGRRLDVVSRDLQALARHGIVELEKVGRAKRVHRVTDWVLIHLGTYTG